MEKNGLSINKAGYAQDRVKLNASELQLLATGDGVEIMIQEIGENVTFDICSSDDNISFMEFFYVLEGQIEYFPDEENEKMVLTSGDYFYTKVLTHPSFFKTITKTKLLYASTQPIFHYLGESLSELHKINSEIEMKDQYTHAHSERVKDLTVKIALDMQLKNSKMVSVAIAALFHDLGKVNIDIDILNKKGKLTDEEFAIIKQHPIDSAKFVKRIKYIDVSEIVIQHHERLNGSGYPNGLKGNEICIEAKIIAVADTYDAMTSDRPYRNAVNPHDAIAEIKSLSGVFYEPLVVDSLINVLKKDNII